MPAPTTSSSFTEFLDAYGRMFPPALAYNEDVDLQNWQPALRKKLSELKGPLPPRVPLKVVILDSVQEADHTRHLLEITVSAISTLPAYLLVPHNLAEGEKRPGLLLSHGHDAFGFNSLCVSKDTDDEERKLRAYAVRAVRRGYVVMVPSWWGFDGRDGHIHLCKDGEDKCNKIQVAASMYGCNVLDLHMQDAEAAVDVLAARPEVDPTRLGCAGNSYGGRTAMWFTIFDERISACVASGSMNTFRERSSKLASCGIQYPFGLLRYADIQDLFCLISPRPLQLQAGRGDRLIPVEDRDLVEKNTRSAYRKLGAEANFDFVLHDFGHRLEWPHAEKFFARHLNWQLQ